MTQLIQNFPFYINNFSFALFPLKQLYHSTNEWHVDFSPDAFFWKTLDFVSENTALPKYLVWKNADDISKDSYTFVTVFSNNYNNFHAIPFSILRFLKIIPSTSLASRLAHCHLEKNSGDFRFVRMCRRGEQWSI